MLKHTLGLAATAAVAVAGAQTAAAQARDQIRIVGSSTVYPFATAVVEKFGRTTDFPTPVIESTGSGGGLQLFCKGVGAQHPDITNASRRIKPSEVEKCQNNGVNKITEVKIGSDGIVLANSVKAEPMDVSLEEIWLALAKEVPNGDGEMVANPHDTWSDIDADLPDKEIAIMGPPPTSGTRDAWNEMVMLGGCKQVDAMTRMSKEAMHNACLTYREDGAWIEAGENDNLIVQKLEANANRLGIFGYSFLDQNRNTIQAASINGAEPTVENISSGDYPVARSLWFYVKNAHVGNIPGMKTYVEMFMRESSIGPDGFLIGKGLIPLPEGERNAWQGKATTFQPLDPDMIEG